MADLAVQVAPEQMFCAVVFRPARLLLPAVGLQLGKNRPANSVHNERLLPKIDVRQ
jgi:hypothetical protein